ncbi:hypothetical protein ACO0QE_002842 [Hanseniaspora vineae]
MKGIIPRETEKRLVHLLYNNQVAQAVKIIRLAKSEYQLNPSVGLFKTCLAKSIENGYSNGVHFFFDKWIVKDDFYQNQDNDLEQLFPKMAYVTMNKGTDNFVITERIIEKYRKIFLDNKQDGQKSRGSDHVFYLMQALQVENVCKHSLVRHTEQSFKELWKLYLKEVDHKFNFDNGLARDILSAKDFPYLARSIQKCSMSNLYKFVLHIKYVEVRNMNSFRLLLTLVLMEPKFSLTEKTLLLEKFQKVFENYKDIINYAEPLKVMERLKQDPQLLVNSELNILDRLKHGKRE